MLLTKSEILSCFWYWLKSTDFDLTTCWLFQTDDQINNSTLSRTIASNKHYCLFLLNFKADILNDGQIANLFWNFWEFEYLPMHLSYAGFFTFPIKSSRFPLLYCDCQEENSDSVDQNQDLY